MKNTAESFLWTTSFLQLHTGNKLSNSK